MKPPEGAAHTTLYFPSKEELAMFQRAAELEGKPLSVWMREMAAKRAVKVLATHRHKCPACGGVPRAARKRAAA